jgi:hypothetical protein|tara:strand:- start:1157 stop:1696 length:540 start_codon:yes stop_codon:yes gene_type:complete
MILIYFTYYYSSNRSLEDKNLAKISKEKVTNNEESEKNSFEDIEYNGIDLNGNRYVLESKKASFEKDTPENIDLKIMKATFYFKDGSILKVIGDYGTYNNKTHDMKFRENIIANYTDNILYADNFDFLNSKNLLSIYGNIKTESIQGNIEADNILVDLSSKTIDMSMFDNKQVNVNLRK